MILSSACSSLLFLKSTPRTVLLRGSAIRGFSVASKVTTAHFRDVISGVAESRQDIWKQIELTTRRHDELVALTTRRHDELVVSTSSRFSDMMKRQDKLLYLLIGTVLGGFISSTLYLDQKIEQSNEIVIDKIKEIKQFIVESNKKKWI
jgi:hypothetical protein